MGRDSTTASVHQIGTLLTAGAIGQLTDRRLLERFLARSGGSESEAAFEVLVRRHGPMVQSVCRKLLRDSHGAEDAFQATFLVLARRASSIRERDAVASWLFGVASRVAARARADAERVRALERRVAEQRLESTQPSTDSTDLSAELFAEVHRLPERYQAPIILCYLEGHTHEQAAATLRCPVRSLQTRLLRAKARLRTRLIKRGLAPAIGMLAAEHLRSKSGAAAAASLPFALIESTTRAATGFALARAGTGALALASASVLTLTQGVLQTMVRNSLRHSIGLASGLAASLALVIFALAAVDHKSNDPKAKEPNAKQPVRAITGRVFDQQGKPIAGAEVWLPVTMTRNDEAASHATTDAQGHYVLKAPDLWQQTPIHRRSGIIWALALGHQVATASAYEQLEGEPGPVELTLGPATDTAFVVLGPEGRPVSGAVVEPLHVLTPMAYNFPPGPMLPKLRAVTDATGRAGLPALPRKGFLTVQVSTEELGNQHLRIIDKASEPAERIIRLRPAGRVVGRVEADRPFNLGGLKVYLATSDPDGNPPGAGLPQTQGAAQTMTEADGTFSVPAIAGGRLEVGLHIDPNWPVRPRLTRSIVVRPGEVTHLEIPLKKAVKVRGVIRVKGSNRPIPGASIHVYYDSQRQGDTVVSDQQGRYETYAIAGDVRLQVIVMPDNFVEVEEQRNDPYIVPAGVREFELPAIEVVPGRTIKGRLVRGTDWPIVSALITGYSGNRRYLLGKTHQNGEFTLTHVPPGLPLKYTAVIEDEGEVETSVLSEERLLLRVGPGTTTPGDDVPARGKVRDPQDMP
jgi:RNA polymerase sigma factor (sigma-70 family)